MRGGAEGEKGTASRGSVRDEHKRLTRARIVAAAQVVFEARGYGAASIGDITAEADVHRATFYLHFTAKAECFLAVIDEVLPRTAEYWSRLDKALVEGTPHAIKEWLADAVHWYEEQSALLPAWQEAMAVDKTIARRWKSYLDELAEELVGYLEQFACEERDEARLRIELLVVQLTELCFRWIVQEVVDLDRERMLDMLADLWCRSLGIAPSTPG